MHSCTSSRYRLFHFSYFAIVDLAGGGLWRVALEGNVVNVRSVLHPVAGRCWMSSPAQEHAFSIGKCPIFAPIPLPIYSGEKAFKTVLCC